VRRIARIDSATYALRTAGRGTVSHSRSDTTGPARVGRLCQAIQVNAADSPLDRPAWASLSTHHAPLSEGNSLARRFVPDVNLFASARDDTPAALGALAALVQRDERVLLLQVPAVVVPPGLRAINEAKGVQMVASRQIAGGATRAPGAHAALDDVLILSDADAPEMLALATLTQPGPFLARTHVMGRFIGIRIDERLVAMAGERMRFPGFTEVSGVCTHPEFRGRGFARHLSAAVATAIVARGDRPFLHAWKTNHAAIALYEGLGFEQRAEVNVAELVRNNEEAR
jgi:predicted GNAT family acetyltransferase